MKRTILTFLFATLFVMSYGQNLISNWQFQYPNMQPRCDGWFNPCGEELIVHCDTNLHCFTGLSNQSPSANPEDIWSLNVKTGFPHEGYAETYITGQSGTNIYELTFWMKATDWLGGAILGTNTQNQFIASKTLIDTTAIWKQFTLVDTLTTQHSDTITVRLTAGTGDFCFCPPINFSFIELNKIEVTSTSDIDNLEQHVKAYPNPTNSKMTIEVIPETTSDLRLDIYNTIGQLVATRKTSGNTFAIDKNDVGSGLYFYTVQTSLNQRLIGQGKIMFDE